MLYKLSLPFDAHIPCCQFCGPGTKLETKISSWRLRNPLVRFEITNVKYSKNNKMSERHNADKVLENKTSERVKGRDSLKSKRASLIVRIRLKTYKGISMKKNSSVVLRFWGKIYDRSRKLFCSVTCKKLQGDIMNLNVDLQKKTIVKWMRNRHLYTTLLANQKFTLQKLTLSSF